MNNFLVRNLTSVMLASLFLWCAACKAQSGKTEQPGKTDQFPPPGRLVDVGGYRVHINCSGTGSSTVMIVGAGFSFDWALVQPEVAKFTRVCTYDPSGSAWSDPGPSPTCDGRVAEIHALLQNSGITGPVVLVGHSIGAVFARLYASRYPNDVAGMVIVDHAAIINLVSPGVTTVRPTNESGAAAPLTPPPGLPKGVSKPISLADDPAFQKLPLIDQERHRWAESLPNGQSPLAQRRFYDQCLADVADTTRVRPDPLGNIPLVVISTSWSAPEYLRLQTQLLALSHHSKQLIADKSGHAVPIEQPEVVVSAIKQVVDAVGAPR